MRWPDSCAARHDRVVAGAYAEICAPLRQCGRSNIPCGQGIRGRHPRGKLSGGRRVLPSLERSSRTPAGRPAKLRAEEKHMITPEHARTLFAYDAWANRRMLDACAALSGEQFTKDLGSSFRSVRDTLAHIMGAQWLWLERFRGRSLPSLPSAEQFADLASLRARWTQMERELVSYVEGLSAADLDRSFDYRDTKG